MFKSNKKGIRKKFYGKTALNLVSVGVLCKNNSEPLYNLLLTDDTILKNKYNR